MRSYVVSLLKEMETIECQQDKRTLTNLTELPYERSMDEPADDEMMGFLRATRNEESS